MAKLEAAPAVESALAVKLALTAELALEVSLVGSKYVEECLVLVDRLQRSCIPGGIRSRPGRTLWRGWGQVWIQVGQSCVHCDHGLDACHLVQSVVHGLRRRWHCDLNIDVFFEEINYLRGGRDGTAELHVGDVVGDQVEDF